MDAFTFHILGRYKTPEFASPDKHASLILDVARLREKIVDCGRIIRHLEYLGYNLSYSQKTQLSTLRRHVTSRHEDIRRTSGLIWNPRLAAIARHDSLVFTIDVSMADKVLEGYGRLYSRI